MRRTLTTAAAAVVLLAAGCIGRPGTFPTGGAAGGRAAGNSPTGTGLSDRSLAPHASLTLRLGFVADMTQASALVGVREGFFAASLAPHVALQAIPFRTDAAEAAALGAGKLDAAYASASVILSRWRAGRGARIYVISGAASGGAALVVRPHIRTAAQLKGTALGVTSAGGAEDIALRYWLHRHHLGTGPGGVTITAVPAGAAAVRDFTSGRIAGAWEPVPYDIEMVHDGGHILASEASQWPGGQFATANLVVSGTFLSRHSAAVIGLLKGQIQANDLLHHTPASAALAIATELTILTHTHLPSTILAGSLAQITFTNDPIAASLATQAQHAAELGIANPISDITGFYDLSPLNLLLRQAGEPSVRP